MRYFIFLSYRGTNYHGWQRQPRSMTVQQLLEEVLSAKLREPIAVTGAGRTDTGVHALIYCAHFDSLRDDLAGNVDFIFSLNRFLPDDVAADRIVTVRPDANARYSATERTYIYRIVRRKDPFNTETGWYLSGELDIGAMNDAAEMLTEYKDFASFCRTKTDVRTTLCEVTSAQWTETGNILEFRITSDRFLRNMVRAITGSMIDIGQKKMSLAEFQAVIEARNRTKAGQSAPAHGLFLAGIEYPPEVFL